MRTILMVAAGLVLGAAACGDDEAGGADTSADVTSDAAPGDTAIGDTTGATETTSAPTDAGDDVPVDTDPIEVADSGGDVAPDAVDTTDPGDSDVGEVVSVPLPGFGAISGDCGVLDDELTSDDPSYFVARYDFATDPYDAADLALLTEGAQEILADGNAGGSSIRSEMFTFELLARCELATLVKTENEVVYDDAQSKKTDMILRIDGVLVGTNPTRAIGFPFDAPYSEAQARTILEKKLGDINESTQYVSAADRWVKQILVVFAYGDGHAASVQAAWSNISADLKRDTIAYVVVTDGADLWIYSDQE